MTDADFSCRICPDRDICQEPCEWMEKQLPKEPMHSARQRTYGLWPSVMAAVVIPPPSNRGLIRLSRRLTTREWQVVRLIYRDGLTQEEAADKLSISRRTVRDCVSRARRKLAAAHAKIV